MAGPVGKPTDLVSLEFMTMLFVGKCLKLAADDDDGDDDDGDDDDLQINRKYIRFDSNKIDIYILLVFSFQIQGGGSS